MHIQQASQVHIAGIHALLEELWQRSNYARLEPARERWPGLIAAHVQTPHSAVFVAMHAGQVVGVMCVPCEHSFARQPMAHVYVLYVSAAHRRSRAAKGLLDAAMAKVKAWGACVLFAGFASGLGTDANLDSIYRKYGLLPVGTYYRRSF